MSEPAGDHPRAVGDGATSPFPFDHRRLLLVGGGLVVLTLVMLLAEQLDAVSRLVATVDDAGHRAAIRGETPIGLAVAQVLSVLGGVYVTAPLRVLVAAGLAVTRRWWWLAAWVVSIAVQEVAVTVMKASFDRARPPAALEVTRQAAFPSGHAGAVTVTAVVVILLAPVVQRTRWRWWALGSFVVALMAASRVYLRVHWLSDVVVGCLVGAIAATVSLGVLGGLAERRARPRGVRLRGRMERRKRS